MASGPWFQLPVLQPVSFETPVNIPVVLCLTNAFLSYTQASNLYILVVMYSYFAHRVSLRWKQENSLSLYIFFVMLTVLTGTHVLLGPAIYLLMVYDRDKTKLFSVIRNAYEVIEALITEISIPLAKPLVGVNSYTWIMVAKQMVDDHIDRVFECFRISESCDGIWLRENGISQAPIPNTQRSKMMASSTHQRYEQITASMRTFLMGISAIISMAMAGPVGVFGILLVYLVNLQRPEIDLKKREIGNRYRDGIYRIETTSWGVLKDQGIGVAWQGVMHVPYHVSRSYPIQVGGLKTYPYYVSIEEDIVTYGGPPQISSVEEGDVIYVNCETDTTRTSYKVEINVDVDTSTLNWIGVSKPGESGSPVYAYNEGNLKLLGQVGRYIREEGEVVEYTNIKPHFMVNKNIERVIMAPGSGKTWRVIPQTVKAWLPKLRGKKTVVSGPTRVVCKELFSSLHKDVEVGLQIQNSIHRNPMAAVQIAAHKTALKGLVQGARSMHPLGMIMIDEAHVDDPATIMLRNYAKFKSDEGVHVVELSATLDGENKSTSQYEIEDKDIREGEVNHVVEEHLEKGDRVMVFVTSSKSAVTNSLKTKFKSYKPVMLCRDNFQAAMKSIADVENRLILTTDIAECGINVPDLDVVVDLGKKFNYIEEQGVVVGREVGITEASRIQRRGRVGRVKRGIYYQVPNKLQKTYKTSAQHDAELLMTGRSWSTTSNDSGIMLSEAQFEAWLEVDKTPIEIWYRYDIHGRMRNPVKRREMLEQNRTGNNFYTGCGRKGCPCEGWYKHFDERAHDFFMGYV